MKIQVLLTALIPKWQSLDGVTIIPAVATSELHDLLFQQADASRLLRKISRLLLVSNQCIAGLF